MIGHILSDVISHDNVKIIYQPSHHSKLEPLPTPTAVQVARAPIGTIRHRNWQCPHLEPLWMKLAAIKPPSGWKNALSCGGCGVEGWVCGVVGWVGRWWVMWVEHQLVYR